MDRWHDGINSDTASWHFLSHLQHLHSLHSITISLPPPPPPFSLSIQSITHPLQPLSIFNLSPRTPPSLIFPRSSVQSPTNLLSRHLAPSPLPLQNNMPSEKCDAEDVGLPLGYAAEVLDELAGFLFQGDDCVFQDRGAWGADVGG